MRGAEVARLPDRREQQRQFQTLDFAERRAIVKAVNRGRAVEVRRHAPIAVGVAQRQIRFWKWAWLFGPAVGAAQVFVAPIEVALANGLIGGLIIGAMAWYLIGRAKRALVANLELTQGKSGTKQPDGHLARAKRDGADGGGSATSEQATGTAPRPPAPRGKKRRKR
jgi:hypothetical protein